MKKTASSINSNRQKTKSEKEDLQNEKINEAIHYIKMADLVDTRCLRNDFMVAMIYANLGEYSASISVLKKIMQHGICKISCLTMIGIEYSMFELPIAAEGIEYFTKAIKFTKFEIKHAPYLYRSALVNLYTHRSNLYQRMGLIKEANDDLSEVSKLMVGYI
jgi:lipopolysaccharide biosynthesis regulator YciM